MVVSVAQNGQCFYATNVEPFKGRNAQAAADEVALRSLLDAAKREDVKVYLSVDALKWQQVQPIVSAEVKSTQPKTEEKKAEVKPAPLSGIFSKYPDWQEKLSPSALSQGDSENYASPFHADVRSTLNGLLVEIGEKFPQAAGIVLNVSLSSREILGFSDAARVGSITDIGLDPVDLNLQNRADEGNTRRVQQWIDWRNAQMKTLVQSLRDSYKAKNPKGRVLITGTADYYERKEGNDLRLAQDWESWLDSKLADGVLLEGRYGPRYTDARYLRDFVKTDEAGDAAPRQDILPVLSGDHLVADGSYGKEWIAIKRLLPQAREAVISVQDEDDLKRVLALMKGQFTRAQLTPALPQPGEMAPEWTMVDAKGQEWSSQALRGKSGYELLLLGREAPILPETALQTSQNVALSKSERSLPLFVVSARSAKPNAGNRSENAVEPHSVEPQVTALVDGAGDLLSVINDQSSLLVSVDRAGFVRSQRAVKSTKQLRQSREKANENLVVLQEGKPAPAFNMLDMNGKRWAVPTRGKKLLLTFFPKCFTGGCTNHLTSINNVLDEFTKNNTDVLAVSIDPADVQIAFANRWNLRFSLIPDTGRHLSLLYGTAENIEQLSARMSVVIDEQGIVRLINRNVQVSTHGKDLLDHMRIAGLIK